jgi:hypothetical protein
MKTRFTSLLVSLVAFTALSQSAVAAPKKADERPSALVTALQAVSPDPLGGKLGLAASGARTEVAPATTGSNKRTLTVQASRAVYDQRAYLIWKSANKS